MKQKARKILEPIHDNEFREPLNYRPADLRGAASTLDIEIDDMLCGECKQAEEVYALATYTTYCGNPPVVYLGCRCSYPPNSGVC